MNENGNFITKAPGELSSQHSPEWNAQLADLVSNIPAGVCTVLLDESFTLVYGNTSFFEFYGYTPGQMQDELQNEIMRTIHPDDLEDVQKVLNQAQHEAKPGFGVEHRVICRDKTVIWILVSGNFTMRQGRPAANCVVMDITGRKKTEEALRIDEERFRIALAQMDNTLFDYDISTRVMIHADKSAEKYGIAHVTKNVPDSLVEAGVIHPDSVQDFLDTYQKIRDGFPSASCAIKTKIIDGDYYVWRKIILTTIFDREGHAVRAVGLLEDIDEQKRREEQLVQRSEQDSLTGLYHKGVTESRIRTCLAEPGSKGALFVIDIDEFKSINDHYGHMFGDRVLAESARRISTLFGESDTIGRIGGDEFMIYIAEPASRAFAYHKAVEICELFQAAFEVNGIVANISCSLGATLVPDDGTAFEELYQKADIALYEAKQKGRNRFFFYEPGMGRNMEWILYGSTAIDGPQEQAGRRAINLPPLT